MYRLDTLMSVMQSLCVEPEVHRRFNNELNLSFIDNDKCTFDVATYNCLYCKYNNVTC